MQISREEKRIKHATKHAPHLPLVDGGYLRKASYRLPSIMKSILDDNCTHIELDGDVVSVESIRLSTFAEKGVKCVVCGVEGSFFAKEKSWNQTRPSDVFHLNLYALKGDGSSVLMTKDHIVPRSKGGTDHLNNMQTMCTRCNCKKGDSL